MTTVCLKSGFIVDGTGKEGFRGDILLDGKRIKYVSRNDIKADCQ
jgi:N-acyl-D-aspartate/D-glutamate deacylase